MSGTLTFGSPGFLLGLIPVVGVAVYLVWRRRARRDPALKFSAARLWQQLPPSPWARLAWLPDGLRILALTLIVMALARPQRVGEATPDDTEGIDIVMALDTSCSMRAADFQPRNRMAVAKNSIASFVKERTVDRIGLVVFAGEASTWVPLTLDYSLLASLLDDVDVGMLPDGTAIG
ncbi:MAG: VWA domain-containing protein, partial [Myxococcota bacterium]